MIIVADTTPLHYLILIGEAEVLKELFGRIIIPQAVVDELTRERTPQPVRNWIDTKPHWLDILQPSLELDDLSKSLGKAEVIIAQLLCSIR